MAGGSAITVINSTKPCEECPLPEWAAIVLCILIVIGVGVLIWTIYWCYKDDIHFRKHSAKRILSRVKNYFLRK